MKKMVKKDMKKEGIKIINNKNDRGLEKIDRIGDV